LLDSLLQEMCHCIEKVFQLAVATFNKAASAESSKRNLELLISQTNKLRSTDVGLEYCSVFRSSHRTEAKAPVTYIPIAENKHVSVGIFVIREGQNIPLHDHPHMHGIIKCLKGNLRITSFTKADNHSTPERFRKSPSLIEKLRFGELFLAEQSGSHTVGPESSCCILSPQKSNIHKIESIDGPAAFLDILAPPYNIDPHPYSDDQQERDCHYFRVLSEPGPEQHKWMLMCDPPASFDCSTEQYQGPELETLAD